ncbi:peptide-methionine (S)-S-oxide reductase MsrA [Aquibacillus albus]|uniref:Peptide methionine sulfoxide reductase MsrA n=1 Tax=Aquibacillus albus TaxID=1168171 RepID=A0ABS2N2B9_9BACI|nr:peptide-methionine (S)-S-oxide reductase MsrA [Aquibacillus albus]MBM7572277.1 peptide-methionine (S)-S-oxide reductase [Aquibacillus albus]
MKKQVEKATFAGGCFWCMVKPFDQWDGVETVISGYTGGTTKQPSYEQVKTGTTGHYEAVQIEFVPEIIPYEKIVSLYWQQIDPTDANGQFHDRGSQYRTAIFYHNEKQKVIAEKSKENIKNSGRFTKPIVTEILPATTFYPAEDFHQEFYKKNKKEYDEDRAKSGRDKFIESYWQT